MAAAHDHADDHDDHAHGAGHDHDDHGHDEAVEEDSVRTPMWLPFVGIALLLFGAVYTYSVMHEPPAAAAASAEASASAGEGSAAPAAPAPAH